MKRSAVVGLQLLCAGVIIAAGIVVLAGPGAVAQRFVLLGFGEAGQSAVGAMQILAGLCLLLPRGHIFGTALLAVLTIGVFAGMVGHVAAGGSARTAPGQGGVQVHSAIAGSCRGGGRPFRLAVPHDWAI